MNRCRYICGRRSPSPNISLHFFFVFYFDLSEEVESVLTFKFDAMPSFNHWGQKLVQKVPCYLFENFDRVKLLIQRGVVTTHTESKDSSVSHHQCFLRMLDYISFNSSRQNCPKWWSKMVTLTLSCTV